MTDKEVPDFCIFQNSRTRQSAIWTKQVGWRNCQPDEYLAIAVVADLLRNSPNVKATMKDISKIFIPPEGYD
tara:strand:+ start:381 stop:596 length:216 start_codon:yes stop_codon:yes gene_type:complete